MYFIFENSFFYWIQIYINLMSISKASLKNGQFNQVPLAKLCPRQFTSALNDNTDTDSRNSNSSICSQTTNEDGDIYVSSNDTFQPNNETVLTKLKNELSTSPLEICVDCFQLMESLNVADVAVTPPPTEFHNHRKKSSNFDFVKILYKTTATTPQEFFHQKASNYASCQTPEALTMTGLSHINSINDSPFVKKFSMSHHSTPTPSALAPVTPLSEYTPSGDEDQLRRQNLTLNLQPIYTNTLWDIF